MQREKTIHNRLYHELITHLYQERKRLGLSQQEVASQLGMTQSEISKIENMERRIDVLEFKKLLNTYRIKNNCTLKQFILNFLELD